jgi:nitroimidazol reductase NimA-like FMN-containing flavoprotein (pyridoxamine 5'-phosphate oxidase superfamily)
MVIREMSREECLRVLAGRRLARLACAHENQPYVVPVYLAYYEPSGGEVWLYGSTTPGMKVEWMRTNPLVCVEVDEVMAYDQWTSVIALGRYEELPETPGCDDERLRAWQVLKSQPVWWEPGSSAWTARAHRDPAQPFIPVYYRVRIDHITGHEATRDARDAISYAESTSSTGRLGWLRKIIHAFTMPFTSRGGIKRPA